MRRKALADAVDARSVETARALLGYTLSLAGDQLDGETSRPSIRALADELRRLPDAGGQRGTAVRSALTPLGVDELRDLASHLAAMLPPGRREGARRAHAALATDGRNGVR